MLVWIIADGIKIVFSIIGLIFVYFTKKQNNNFKQIIISTYWIYWILFLIVAIVMPIAFILKFK